MVEALAGSPIYVSQNGYLVVNTKYCRLAYANFLYRQHKSHCQWILVVLFLLLEGLLVFIGNTAGEYLYE